MGFSPLSLRVFSGAGCAFQDFSSIIEWYFQVKKDNLQCLLNFFAYLLALSSAISLSVLYFSLTLVVLGRCQSSLVPLHKLKQPSSLPPSTSDPQWGLSGHWGFPPGCSSLHWWFTVQLYTFCFIVTIFCSRLWAFPPAVFEILQTYRKVVKA